MLELTEHAIQSALRHYAELFSQGDVEGILADPRRQIIYPLVLTPLPMITASAWPA
jgi:hypothetical protein